MLFDPKRYDLAKVGRYKFNKKLAFRNRIVRHVLAEDVMDKSTGEIIGEKGTEVTVELADKMQNAAVPYVWIQGEDRNVKVLSNLMVDINTYLPELNKEEVGITELVYYPKLMDVMELAKVIAEYFSNKINDKVTHKQVFIGNGSDEVLAFIFMTFFNAGDKVYYPDITYSFYPVYADLFNVEEVKIPLNDSFEIEIQKYFGLDGHIIIANPNAPTSIALKLDEIEEIVKNNPNQLVIVDEAYVDFGAESVVKLINKYDNVLVVQTFSKSRSMAGIRLGYAFGSENIIEGLNRLKFSFNSYTIDRISIEAGIESFKDDEYFEKTNAKIIQTREKTTEKLKKLGFKVLNSSANFIFISHNKVFAGDLYKQLKENGVLVRYFAKNRIDNYLRITIGTDEEMGIFIEKLEEIIFQKEKILI